MSSNSAVAFSKKLRAVQHYMSTKQSVRQVARRFSVSYSTLYSWIKQYKKNGEDGLRGEITRKRRIPKSTERDVVMLKERNPSLSIKAAHQALKKRGISISQKGIWQIWRRYGLGKRSSEHPLSPFCIPTYESEAALKKVKMLLEEKKFKKAASLLNDIPCLPDTTDNEILKQIPEKILVPRRKLDRIALELGQIPFAESMKKAHRIAKRLEEKEFLYSSILANFVELQVSAWTGTAMTRLQLLRHMEKKMRGIKDTALWFFFYIELAMVYSDRLEIKKAFVLMRKCRKLVRLLPPPDYHAALGSLMTFLGRYKEAGAFFEIARRREHNSVPKAQLTLMVAYARYHIAGEYSACRKMLSKALIVKHAPAFGASYSLFKAFTAFGEGNLAEATQYFVEALKKATKGELHNLLYGTSVGLAGIALALNQKSEARIHLKKYLTLMKKVGSAQEFMTLQQLLGSNKPIPQELQCMPPARLLSLLVRANTTMRISNYKSALDYAERHRIMGLLHRLVVFFPRPVNRVLDKGKQTGLPRAILRFPIFNERTPVYHMKFLGTFVLSKDHQYMRTKPSPKETAFLVHLALRAGTPGKFILLKDLCQNFWAQSRDPQSLLLHLLASIRKKLKIPSHLLAVSSAYAEPRLINRGLYTTTDFEAFGTLLTQSMSLERAGEWAFAKRDYLQAFTLVRGEPFRKMYDPWSENTRARILSTLEDKGTHFAKNCLTLKDYAAARKVLEKIVSVVPHSPEANALLKKTHKK